MKCWAISFNDIVVLSAPYNKQLSLFDKPAQGAGPSPLIVRHHINGSCHCLANQHKVLGHILNDIVVLSAPYQWQMSFLPNRCGADFGQHGVSFVSLCKTLQDGEKFPKIRIIMSSKQIRIKCPDGQVWIRCAVLSCEAAGDLIE